jgi:pyruvate/2-oxoglutarate dehydrogenase complex dihydrolipoamide acyltransferase (E2) component
MNENSTFEERSFPKTRQIIIDLGEIGKKVHTSKILIELDVTEGRTLIRDHKERTGKSISFTGWIMKCVGHAVNEHKEIHAIRKGKRKTIIFNDVDISVQVERVVEGHLRPMPFVVRKVNEKSVQEITTEIRVAQTVEIGDATLVFGSQEKLGLWERWFPSLPKFLRKFIWRKGKDPFTLKRIGGTVGITSVGMFGKFSGWPIPESPGLYPLLVALGGITKKPGVVGDKIQIREYLYATVLFNHDIVDGAPALRFIARLTELVEDALGLIEQGHID